MTSLALTSLLLGLFVALPAVLISGWVRWARNVEPRGTCSMLSLVGFTFATTSSVLALSSMLYAQLIGGFGYYDPLLLSIYRCGLLLALVGIGFAVSGVWRPHHLRWHSPVLSVGMLLFWFLMAIGE